MNETDKGYIAQGYTLPQGYTWEHIAKERARLDLESFFVPCAVVPGIACAWGVPMINGKFLKREATA